MIELVGTDTMIYDRLSTVRIVLNDSNAAKEIPVEGDTSWIKGKRCLAKNTNNGVAICYLDENDSTKYHDGTNAALDGTQGQWMVDLPSYWLEHIGQEYANPADPEDLDHTLVLEHRDADDEENDQTWNKTDGNKVFSRRVLLGVTEAVNVGGKLWSRSNNEQSTGSLTASEFHRYANALGTGWDIIDYETHCKIAHLFYAKYGNKDAQGQLGAGQDSYRRIIGTTYTLGNKDGADANNVSFLGIENPWGCKYEWMSGIHSNKSIYYIYDGY